MREARLTIDELDFLDDGWRIAIHRKLSLGVSSVVGVVQKEVGVFVLLVSKYENGSEIWNGEDGEGDWAVYAEATVELCDFDFMTGVAAIFSVMCGYDRKVGFVQQSLHLWLGRIKSFLPNGPFRMADSIKNKASALVQQN